MENYFNFIRRHCSAKLQSRVADLQSSLRLDTRKNAGKFVTPALPLLKTRITEYGATDPPEIDLSWGDRKAKSLSPKGNLYDGLLIALEKLASNAVKPTSTWNYLNLSMLCSVLGESTYVRSLNRHPELLDLIENIQKMGQYFRGARFLYDRIMDPKYRPRFRNITIELVDSPDRLPTKPGQPDWYTLLGQAEQLRTGSPMSVTRNRFQGEFGGVSNYGKRIQEYTAHATWRM
jgi:hypothetical protein